MAHTNETIYKAFKDNEQQCKNQSYTGLDRHSCMIFDQQNMLGKSQVSGKAYTVLHKKQERKPVDTNIDSGGDECYKALGEDENFGAKHCNRLYWSGVLT
eukprot:14376905-Heterocapsa_arctica.AAC.1